MKYLKKFEQKTLDVYKSEYKKAKTKNDKTKVMNRAILNLSHYDKEEFIKWQTNYMKSDQINEDFSERFAYQFIKPTDNLLTISESSEVDDAIKTGNKIAFENYIIIPDLEKITCLVVKDAPKSKFGYKKIQHYRYKSIERMILDIKKFIDSIKKYRKEKEDYSQEKKLKQQEGIKNIKNIINVGDIVYDSWGYEQTNIDFYQVTKVLNASVIIRPISSETVPGSEGNMCANVKPVANSFVGDEIRKNVRIYGDKYYLPSKYGSISKYESGDEGVYSSWYA